MLTIWAPALTSIIDEQNFHIGYGRLGDSAAVNESFFVIDVELAVQADGDELEKIRRQFQNIPMTNNLVVRWYGETARFIFENLEL